MLERVEIRVTDVAASAPLYDLLDSPEIAVLAADGAHPPTRRLHVAVFAADRAAVDRFWLAATRAGFRDDGEPGMRPQHAADCYGAFVLDPDIAHAAGLRTGIDRPDWIQFLGDHGFVSFVAGEPVTSNVRLVFASGAEGPAGT